MKTIMPTWNAITIARACRAGLSCLGGLALVILLPSLAEATFGPRTIIGKNYQQWSSTTSPDGINQDSCHGQLNCYVLFQQIPQQKPLIVQHVACRASLSSGGLEYASLRTQKRQTIVLRRTPLVPVSTTGGQWAVNSPVMHLLKSGERPYVFFRSSGGFLSGNDCSISGKFQ